MGEKRTRVSLTALQKKEICRRASKANIQQKALAKDMVGAVDESDSELKKEVSTSNALECITTLIDFINQNDYEIDASCMYSLSKLKRAVVLKNTMKINFLSLITDKTES